MKQAISQEDAFQNPIRVDDNSSESHQKQSYINMILKLEPYLIQYSSEHNPIILQLLLQIRTNNEEEIVKVGIALEKLFNQTLMQILNHSSNEDNQENLMIPEAKIKQLRMFLETLCKSLENKHIKKNIVIQFIEHILQCLGVCDLSEILKVISNQVCAFGSGLEENDQYKLLKIINHLLKRVSKTEDYHIRGELQLALTKFLPICHDSGFHYKSAPAKASDWEKISKEVNYEQENQSISNLLGTDKDSTSISYEFYEEFWELQKYFMDFNELYIQLEGEHHQLMTTIKAPTPIKTTSLLSIRLKKIEQTLSELVLYFTSHKSNTISQYYNQPIKFLKNYNLITLQLNDSYFRKIIMLQVLIFTFSLKNQSPSIKVDKNLTILGDQEKKTLESIESIAIKHLKDSSSTKDGERIYEDFLHLLNNQLYWIDLKDNWKEKKKSFFKKNIQITTPEVQEEKHKKHHDLAKKQEEIKKQISEKMKIDGSNLLRFLQNKEPISLLQSASSTSFSYFYSQAQSCLKSFDFEAGKQTEFETRSEYNMFEWKAMRSLYRQNIKDIHTNNTVVTSIDKNGIGKMKDYRLISLMQKREEQFSDNVVENNHEDELKKKVKENQKND